MSNKFKAKYSSVCRGCGEEIEVNDDASYYGDGEMYHWDCRPKAAEVEADADNQRDS